MSNRYWLRGIGDEELLTRLRALVRQDNEQMSDLLAHLAEVEARRLYLPLEFHSMWEYCRLALGFCESAAGRRLSAARVCRQFPGTFARVASGELHLSALGELRRYLTHENHLELFDACAHKGVREIERIIAARFPRPDVRQTVRRLPVRAPDQASGVGSTAVLDSRTVTNTGMNKSSGTGVEKDMGTGVAESVRPKTHPETNGSIQGAMESFAFEASRTGLGADPSKVARTVQSRETGPRAVEPLAANRFAIRFTADAEFCRLLENVQELASHRNASRELAQLMKAALRAYQRELLKDRFAVGARPRKQRAVSRAAAVEKSDPPTVPGRPNIPAAMRRAVYERDGGTCTFVSEEGRRCGARRFLQIDHIVPWAVVREHELTNLRLRCCAHNQDHARRYFGKRHMRAAVKRAKAQRGQASRARKTSQRQA